MNQTSVLLEEAIGNKGFEEQYRLKQAPLITGAINNSTILRTRGTILYNITDRLILTDIDPDVDVIISESARKKYRQRIRRIAYRALLEAKKEEANSSLSLEEYQERIRNLKVSEFTEKVIVRAL